MFDNLKVRFALIGAITLLCVWLVYDRGITLGLDLQGGTHLALEVRDPSRALSATERADAIDRALTVIRTRVDELGVAEPSIQKVGQDRLVVELPGATAEDQRRAKDVIQQTAFLEFKIVQPSDAMAGVMERIDRAIVAAGAADLPAGPDHTADDFDAAEGGAGVGGLLEAAPDTSDDLGDAESGAVEDDEDTLTTPVTADPGAPNQQPFSSRVILAGNIQESGVIPAVYAVAPEDEAIIERYLAMPEVQRLLPRGTEFRWGTEDARGGQLPYLELYLLSSQPMITGEHLQDAEAQREPQFNQPIVTFEFTRRGGRIFERGTGDNIGNLMAITLDERVFSAPVIRSQIGQRGQIDLAGGTIQEARDLALVLRAGALPVPIEIVEERSVGPSLGADSIEQGQIAGIIGISLVVLMMIGYYRFTGVMAVLALVIYIVMVLGSLAGIGATLTLPGIAGIVLSIGMAVDANVLIFERIREEVDAGRSPRVAVNEGFGNAMSAIIDAQITTLLTAFVLFQFGTGPVRGFAVTLGIGLVASMFTAIFITRTFFMLYLDRRSASQPISI